MKIDLGIIDWSLLSVQKERLISLISDNDDCELLDGLLCTMNKINKIRSEVWEKVDFKVKGNVTEEIYYKIWIPVEDPVDHQIVDKTWEFIEEL